MKRAMIVAGVVLLVAALAGAAYLAARMLLPAEETMVQSAGGGDGGRTTGFAFNDGSGTVIVGVHVEPHPDLPDREPEAAGVFVRQEDNSMFVGTGDVQISVGIDSSTGERSSAINHSGPEVEVVVAHDTIIYRDDTEMPGLDDISKESKSVTVPQEITQMDSLDDIGDNCEVQVWGRQQGDRVIAEVLVYRVVDTF